MEKPVAIVGAGLAGSEAALQLASRGIPVALYEMRPEQPTDVHRTDACAELVCSNSLKSTKRESAAGMLKAELDALGSRLYAAALRHAVPAGGALAVDRNAFAQDVTEQIEVEPRIDLRRQEVKGLQELQRKQFNSALNWFDRAVNAADDDGERDRYARYYKAFYLMNRGVLKAEMIDFIASLEGSVQTLSMDTEGSTRARVSDRVARSYDYSDAIADIKAALAILPDVPYLYFDLGNLECLSSRFIEALEDYDMAIKLYPNMGDAYYNRGLVLIYLKDKEKGCIDLSRAGELGVTDSYSVISKYCSEDEVN